MTAAQDDEPSALQARGEPDRVRARIVAYVYAFDPFDSVAYLWACYGRFSLREAWCARADGCIRAQWVRCLAPLLTWWLAIHVFMLQISLATVSVVLAALPTGTGPFMLTEYYKREADASSRVVLLSAVGAAITLTFVLMLIIQRGWECAGRSVKKHA